MSASSNTPNRALVGFITLLCFGVAIGMWSGGYTKDYWLMFSGFIRVGTFMAAVWYALPTSKRAAAWVGMSPWVVAGIAVGIFLLPRLRFSIPILIGMLVFGMFIRPRKKSGARTRNTIQTTATKKKETES